MKGRWADGTFVKFQFCVYGEIDVRCETGFSKFAGVCNREGDGRTWDEVPGESGSLWPNIIWHGEGHGWTTYKWLNLIGASYHKVGRRAETFTSLYAFTPTLYWSMKSGPQQPKMTDDATQWCLHQAKLLPSTGTQCTTWHLTWASRPIQSWLLSHTHHKERIENT